MNMYTARGKCPHCLKLNSGKSHFAERDAEFALERMIQDCRENRVKRGYSVAETDRPLKQ